MSRWYFKPGPYAPQRVHHLARRRLDGLSEQARQLIVTAAALGPAFRLEDAANILGGKAATLLPMIQEMMDASIIAAAEHEFRFCQELLRRAADDSIPSPVGRALHRRYGEILLTRDGSATPAAGHLLPATDQGDHGPLAWLDEAAAQTLRCAPRIAADLAARALELTPAAGSSQSSESHPAHRNDRARLVTRVPRTRSANVTSARSQQQPRQYEIYVRGHLGDTMRLAFPAVQA